MEGARGVLVVSLVLMICENCRLWNTRSRGYRARRLLSILPGSPFEYQRNFHHRSRNRTFSTIKYYLSYLTNGYSMAYPYHTCTALWMAYLQRGTGGPHLQRAGRNIAIAIPAPGLKTHWYATLYIHGPHLVHVKRNLKTPPLRSSLEGVRPAEIEL